MTLTMVPQWTAADRFRKAREAANLDQAEMAAAIGVSKRSIGNYEAGRTQPGRPVLLSMALATGVSLEWLMYGDGGTSDLGDSQSRRIAHRTEPARVLPLRSAATRAA